MITVLLTYEQCKHLEPDGDMKFKFVGQGIATEKEKQELRELDADYFEVYQHHIITNLNEIK